MLKRGLVMLSLLVFLLACSESTETIASNLVFDDVIDEYFYNDVPFGMYAEVLDIDSNFIHYYILDYDSFQVIKYSNEDEQEVLIPSSELYHDYIASYVVEDDHVYYILEPYLKDYEHKYFEVYKRSEEGKELLMTLSDQNFMVPKLRLLSGTLYGFFSEAASDISNNARQDYIYNFSKQERVLNLPIVYETEMELGSFWVKENVYHQDYLSINHDGIFYNFDGISLTEVTSEDYEEVFVVANNTFVKENSDTGIGEILMLEDNSSVRHTELFVDSITPLAVFEDYTIAIIINQDDLEIVVLEMYNDELLMTSLKTYEGYEIGSDHQDGFYIFTTPFQDRTNIITLKVK